MTETAHRGGRIAALPSLGAQEWVQDALIDPATLAETEALCARFNRAEELARRGGPSGQVERQFDLVGADRCGPVPRP